MGETKKYYWLKLKRDFFKRHDITIIETMPNGDKYLLFYLKLLVESIDHEGELRFSNTVPYNETMLAAITKTDIDIVRSAVKIFQSFGMMEIFDDGTLFLNQVKLMIGNETEWAEKKRQYRDKQKTFNGHKRTLSDKSKRLELELEKELEKEEDNIGANKSPDAHDETFFEIMEPKPKAKRFAPPTLDEVIEFFLQEGAEVKEAQKFWNHFEASNWFRAKNLKISNWKASARNWILRAPEFSPSNSEEKEAERRKKILKEAGFDV